MPTMPYEWGDERWKELISSVVGYTVQPQERVEDVVSGGWALGRYRARVIGRQFTVPDDVPFGLSIFCFYPFKPPAHRESYEYLILNRWRVFEGADEFDENRFIEVVPKDVMRLDLHQLFGLLQTVHIKEIINL